MSVMVDRLLDRDAGMARAATTRVGNRTAFDDAIAANTLRQIDGAFGRRSGGVVQALV